MPAIDIGALNIDQLEELRDAVSRRLLQLRRTPAMRLPELLALFEQTKSTLSDQGKDWYSLDRWQWIDGAIRFWLNPRDQDSYRSGWFTIDELIAWAHNDGPVLNEPEYEDEFDRLDDEGNLPTITRWNSN
jgi:hypothetical protein